MPVSLRPTGVNVLGDVAWGTHACLFYETGQDLLDVLAPYVAAGLEAGEACVCLASEPLSETDVRSALRQRVPALDDHEATGRLDIRPGREWYLHDGKFDPERIVRSWHDKLQRALDRGYEGLRICGNAFRLESETGFTFSDYERELHKALQGRAMIALCGYELASCSGADVFDAARCYEITVGRRRGAWEFLASADEPSRTRALTRREREVLTWIARGKTAWEIGGILEIAKRTVDEHTHSSMRKLGAANRTQAVAIALRSRTIAA
jgi:DNA-binding CsgD family transcriptional regulator